MRECGEAGEKKQTRKDTATQCRRTTRDARGKSSRNKKCAMSLTLELNFSIIHFALRGPPDCCAIPEVALALGVGPLADWFAVVPAESDPAPSRSPAESDPASSLNSDSSDPAPCPHSDSDQFSDPADVLLLYPSLSVLLRSVLDSPLHLRHERRWQKRLL